MYANQYEEHIAHSAPCASRWDGFDRGDADWDYEEEQRARNEADEAELRSEGAAVRDARLPETNHKKLEDSVLLRAADMLAAYAELILRDGASRVEEHHYLPEVQWVAEELRALVKNDRR